MKLHKDLLGAIMRKYDELPEWKKRAFRIVAIDQELKENTSSRTCDRATEDGCTVTYNKVIAVKGTMRCVSRVTKLKWAPVLKENPWWGDHFRVHEEQDTVPHTLIDYLDDETYMALERKKQARGGGAYDNDIMFGMSLQYEEPRPCIRKVGDVWYTCPFHSGYALVRQVLGSDLTLDEKAELIMPFFLRVDRRYKEKPANEAWTWESWFELEARITNVVIRLTTRKKNPLPLKTARKWAWKVLAYKTYPDYNRYKSSVITRRDAPRKYANGSVDILEQRIDAIMNLHEVGMTADLNELIRTYRHYARYEEGLGIVPNLPQSRCPHVSSVPKGTHAATIIRGTACLGNMKVCPEVTPTYRGKPGVPYYVKCNGVDETAAEFNKRPLNERREMLGCKCKHCVQDDIFSYDREMDSFTINGEALIMLDYNFEHHVLPHLVAQYENKHDGISGYEEDELFQTMRDILSSYDVGSLPDEKGVYDLADPNSLEEWSTDSDEEAVMSCMNIDRQLLQDKLDERVDLSLRNDPPVILRPKRPKGQEHIKAFDKAKKAQARKDAAKARTENKEYKKWLLKFRSTPTPERPKSPKLLPYGAKEQAMMALEHKLSKMDEEMFGELRAQIKAYDDRKEREEKLAQMCRDEWADRVCASRGFPARGENKLRSVPPVKRAPKKIHCLYGPEWFDWWFPYTKPSK